MHWINQILNWFTKKLRHLLKFFTLKKIIALAIFSIISLIFNVHSISRYIKNDTKKQIYDNVSATPRKQTALVLGAFVDKNGNISYILKERLDTAIKLYNNSKVEKILVSGDHGKYTYDEVNAMRKYLLNNQIPKEDIFLDHAGFDTYDSIYRSKDIFQVDAIIIVTQSFHLPRALFIANELSIEAVGTKADNCQYDKNDYMIIREKVANLKAFWNTTMKSKPEFRGNQIPISGKSSLSWDEEKWK